MSIISPSITNGPRKLLTSESVLCDDRYILSFSFPTTLGKTETLNFQFIPGDSQIPTLNQKENSNILLAKLGTKLGNVICSKAESPFEVAGKVYYLHFCLTRLLEHTVRAEVSIYE